MLSRRKTKEIHLHTNQAKENVATELPGPFLEDLGSCNRQPELGSGFSLLEGSVFPSSPRDKVEVESLTQA